MEATQKLEVLCTYTMTDELIELMRSRGWKDIFISFGYRNFIDLVIFEKEVSQ